MKVPRSLRTIQHHEIESMRSRIEDLEREVSEVRRHHLRLAEITDIIEELLVPLASRDQGRVDEAIAVFNKRL